jgi:phosphoribosylaminoimidazolecarboxamide formyltransferase/IMP cyclohydrolase
MSKPRALLSVSDKTGIQDFARELVARGWEIVSTGGTARAIREADIEVMDIADVTGHPEMMDGRVKTLHPAVHAGLLARRDLPDHMEAMAGQGYQTIDLVAVNLYPFLETIARPDVTLAEAVEQIDIGGPTMIRSAAKNYPFVYVVVDPADYPLEAIDGGGDPDALRLELATKVFQHTGAYDTAIASYLAVQGEGAEAAEAPADEAMPEIFSREMSRVQTLRYGENPAQEASFYAPADGAVGLPALTQLHGKELSYNNFLDLDGSLLALSPFAFSESPAVSIVKHTTPCGLAVGETLEEAYKKALATDPVSAFGSVIALNRAVDVATAEAMSELFVECIVAPEFNDSAMEVLTKKKNLRLMVMPSGTQGFDGEPSGENWWISELDSTRDAARFLAAHSRLPEPVAFRSVYGGLLAQAPPVPPFYGVAGDEWKTVTERAPTEQEMDDLRFAWAAVFSVKSNAILLAKDGATLGIGAGQMSRVDSSKIAVRKAGEAGLQLDGAVLASDAFFPFRDGVDAAAEAGVKAIVEPGGSVRDEEVIEAANEHGIAMVFTGARLFRH